MFWYKKIQGVKYLKGFFKMNNFFWRIEKFCSVRAKPEKEAVVNKREFLYFNQTKLNFFYVSKDQIYLTVCFDICNTKPLGPHPLAAHHRPLRVPRPAPRRRALRRVRLPDPVHGGHPLGRVHRAVRPAVHASCLSAPLLVFYNDQ